MSIPVGMYHLVVEIWVKNRENQILLTRRHPKKNNGLLWECSGGAVIAGEAGIDGAVRELHEETGILADKNKLCYLGDTTGDNFIVETYLYTLEHTEVELHLQEEEVVDAKFIFIDQMEEMKDSIVSGVWDRFLQYGQKIKDFT